MGSELLPPTFEQKMEVYCCWCVCAEIQPFITDNPAICTQVYYADQLGFTSRLSKFLWRRIRPLRDLGGHSLTKANQSRVTVTYNVKISSESKCTFQFFSTTDSLDIVHTRNDNFFVQFSSFHFSKIGNESGCSF